MTKMDCANRLLIQTILIQSLLARLIFPVMQPHERMTAFFYL